MKKLLSLALLASVFTTSAFASIARLEALGEDQYGSQYIDDERNAFLNAATINDHFDYVTLEWGDTTNRANSEDAGTSTLDGPKAQGGMFKKSGNMVYGVYFGADSNSASNLRSGGLLGLYGASELGGAPTTTNTPGIPEGVLQDLLNTVQNENTLDLFIGGENSWKWGAKFSYASANNEAYTGTNGTTIEEVSKTGMLVGLGAIKGKNEIYANIGVGNEMELSNFGGTAAATNINGEDFHFKGSLGYQLGYVRSLKSNQKVSVELRQQDVEEKEQDLLSETWKVQRVELAWMKESKVNDKFTAFYKTAYRNETQQDRFFIKSKDDWTQEFLRATIGFEAHALDWLTLRGSISNNVFGSITDTDGDVKTDDSTEVRLGATLAFGDFNIDGLIGNDNNADGTAGDDNGTIRTDSLMSRVSMTYKF